MATDDEDRVMTFTELVGVYDADGGVVGEARYVIGHLLGRTECALCDITHSPVRRKPAWDAMTKALGIPFALVHRNEQSADVAAVTATCGLPAVVGRDASGAWRAVLTRDALRAAEGSVPDFERILTTALTR
jgi:hypothetical protein